MKLIIRDDDLSYFAKPETLDPLYKDIWNICPISFAVVPFIYSGQRESPIQFRDTKKLYPIGKNTKLVKFLKEKIAEGKVTIVQHGYSHKNYGSKFECERKDFKKVYEEIRKGKEYLEKLFGIEINCFVAPHDRLSKVAIKAIEKAEFKLICRAYSPLPREVQFNVNYLKSYSKLVKFWFKYKTKYRYPYVLDFGNHKEAYSYRLDSSFIKNVNKIINFIKKNNGLLCVTGHYRTISSHSKEVLKHLVKLRGIEFTHLNKLK